MAEMEGSAADEAVFRDLSVALAAAIEAQLAPWTRRMVEARVRGAGMVVDERVRVRADEAGVRCREQVGPQIHQLLMADVDQQRSTPLVLLRGATVFATEALAELGVPPVERDAYEERAFPADVYALNPATLEDVHESLADPGIAWGAAKAFVHRQRHG